MCEEKLKLFQKLLVSTVATTFAIPLLAQDTLKITVTGTRSEKAVEDIPASITVIDLNDLRDQGNTDLKSITRYEPGISVFDPRNINYGGSQTTGNLNIRGMRQNRILSIQDNIRLPAGFYGVGYDYSNANTVDYFTLKTIDILKGPASSLYGSDALGGVVSFNTLTVDDLLEAGENFKFEVPVKYNGANESIGAAGRVAYRDEESGLSFLAVVSKSDAKELKPNGAADEYVNDAEISTNAALLNVNKQINPSNKIGFTVDLYSKDSDIARASGNLSTGYFNYTKQESDIEQTKNRYIFSWEHDALDETNFVDNLKAKIYYQDYETRDNWNEFQARKMKPFWMGFGLLNDDRDVYSRYKLIDDSYGLDLQLGSNINNHKLTYGLDYSLTSNEYFQDKFTNTNGVISHNYFGTNYPIKRSPDTDTKRLGLYIQDEIDFGKTEMIYGLRFDNYQLDANADSTYLDYCVKDNSTCPVANLDAQSLSPKIAATYNLSDQLKIWGQYSRGFRAPSWWEMQASQTNLSASSPYQTQPNPDLKPESSNSFEIGLKGYYEKFNYGLTGFFNTYDNFIETGVSKGTATVNGVPNVAITTTDNVKGAEIWGIEYNSEYKFTPETAGFSLITSAAYQEGINKETNTDLANIDPFKVVAGLRYTSLDERFTGELIGTYVGEVIKNDVAAYDPEGYYTVDLLAKYQVNDQLDLSLGVNNIFDEEYYQYQNLPYNASAASIEQYREPGRSIQAGFKFTF